MTNVKVKLNVKLQAYTKGIIPDVSKFIEDTPLDNKVYGRFNNEWIELTDLDSLLNEWIGTKDELPDELNENTKYVIIENKPDIVIIGGTAFSNENEEYGNNIITGKAINNKVDIYCIPMNAKGEFIDGSKTNQTKI